MTTKAGFIGLSIKSTAWIIFLITIGLVGCNGRPPIELILSKEEANDSLEITIKNNSREEISFSRRFLTMLPHESSELRVVVSTQGGATVPMCRGLDYFGADSRLRVGAGESSSVEIHTSALIQSHCLDKRAQYSIRFVTGREDGSGHQRLILSNSLVLSPVVER